MSISEVSTIAPEDGTIRVRRVVPQLIVLVWVPLCFAFASVNQQFLAGEVLRRFSTHQQPSPDG